MEIAYRRPGSVGSDEFTRSAKSPGDERGAFEKKHPTS